MIIGHSQLLTNQSNRHTTGVKPVTGGPVGLHQNKHELNFCRGLVFHADKIPVELDDLRGGCAIDVKFRPRDWTLKHPGWQVEEEKKKNCMQSTRIYI